MSDDQLIISVSHARRLLGGEGLRLSDDEVRQLILSMDDLAALVIEMFKVQQSGQAT